jgi:DNA-binding NtrC family response regulator
LVVATNRNLEMLVQEGDFREDLFFRIRVVQILLPPLRDRAEDIPILAEYFRKEYGLENGKANLEFSRKSLDRLREYRWPGNVRELENVVSRAVVCAAAESIEPGDLPPEILGQVIGGVAPGDWWKKVEEVAGKGGDLLAAGEKLLVDRALNEAGGNVKRASEILGVTRAALRTRVDRYGLKGEE